MKKIIRNKAKCRLCGDIIESTHVHDMKSCKCGEISVDGGTDYIRRGWIQDKANIIELSEYEEEYKIPEDEILLFQDNLRQEWLKEIKEIGGFDAFIEAQIMPLPELQTFLNQLKERNDEK